MKRDYLDVGELTPPNRFEIDYIAPAGGAEPFVTTFYHFRCDDPLVRDIQPAAVGHLSLFPLGRGRMSLPDGGFDRTHEVNLLAPLSRAMRIEVDGPFHAVGAALSPLGWVALTGLHAQKYGNRLYDAADWLPDRVAERGQALCAQYRDGSTTVQAIVEELSRMILANANLPSPRHQELIVQVGGWLASSLVPDMAELYAASRFSRRQTQRLVQQFFGVSPVSLRRKYRALRAAAALTQPGLSAEEIAGIHDAFYDQPHMIHEIREFVGRTPARLGDEHSPYLRELIDGKNLRELGQARTTPNC